jgi:riboflavin synthase
MFTGIVAAVGKITRVEANGEDRRLTIAPGNLDLGDVAIGDSIAVNGVCLTVTRASRWRFCVEVSAETLSCTTGLDAPGEVNLEKALRLSDRLGGHLVSGHVDGLGTVVKLKALGADTWLRIRAPTRLTLYVARKGSIAVNGVSLTVNRVDRVEFEVNLIPHTLATTTLKHLRARAKVNLEVDIMARYAERLLNASDK